MRNKLKNAAIGCVLLGAATSACGSDDVVTPASACGNVAGPYSATAERVSGTCDPALDPKGATSFTMRSDGASAYTALLPGLIGGCPGTLDAACRFVSDCAVTDANGATVATAQLNYTFTSKGYTGTSITGLRPPSVATSCEVTYRETGTKL